MWVRIRNHARFSRISRSGCLLVARIPNRVFGRSSLLSAPLVVCLIVGGAPSGAVADPPDLYTFGQSYTQTTKTVSTSVFVWYPGQDSGPWVPTGGVGGAPGWDGEIPFWQDQIKQMMAANIDTMYVHTYGGSTQQMTNLFTTHRQLRTQGYDVPKVAPFLDPIIIWGNPGLDLATTAAKDAFAQAYSDFYGHYDTANVGDAYADSYLAKVDNKPLLTTWHTLQSQNTASLSRTDVESRLSASLGAAHPDFNNGVYMVTTAINQPILSWSDERIAFFETHSYYHEDTTSGVTAAQVMGGYWDENIRNPGTFIPRDGGVNYQNAWNSVQSNNPDRVYVESWNEYDEGSGIYAVDTSASPWIKPGNTNTDTWSTTNDSLEYIKTTAAGARQWNDRPDHDARFLWHNIPAVMDVGETHTVQVVVRNEGDLSWTGAEDYKFGQKEYLADEVLFGPGRYLIDDTQNEIPVYGGIFRGRPMVFEFDLVAPSAPGDYQTHWGMLQEHVLWFGGELTVPITVVAGSTVLPGDYDRDGDVDASDYTVWCDNLGQSVPSGTSADGNANGLVDLADYAIWQTNFGTAAGSLDPMSALVPEPGSLLFLGIGLAVVSGVRQTTPNKRFAQPLRDGSRIAKTQWNKAE